MRVTLAILAGSMAISLAGCALRGSPKTVAAVPAAPKPVAPAPPAPPPPLSIPQTNVELPKPQPLDPEALITAPQPEPVPETSTATRSARRPNTPVVPGAVVPGAVSNPPTRIETPPAPPQPEPERPPIQEIVPAAEQKRLQDSVRSRKAEINQILGQTKSRALTTKQQREISSIRSLIGQADEAEKHGDLRQSDALAERAQILARELQSGQ